MQFHHRAVPIVFAAVAIDAIGFGIVLPVLPRLIVELGHVGLEQAARIGGYMLVAYAVAQFFAGPILGSLGDSIGRRPVLLFSMIAFSIDYAMMSVAPTIGWLFLGRIVAGIAGASFGPAYAVLADVTPPEKRGATFGMIGAAFGIGFILGPALGGLLAGFGPRTPFVVAAALAAANAVWILLMLPETMAADKRRPFDWRRAHVFGAFRPLLHAGKAKWLLLAAFLWQFGHMAYPATWAFFGEIALDWNEQQIGLSLAAAGLSMALVQMFLTGRVVKRFGEEGAMVIGMFAGATVFAGYVFARETWLIYALIVVSALQALVSPSITALLSRMTDASNQGALQGGLASLNSIALIVAPFALTQALAFGAERGFTGGNFVLAATLAYAGLAIVLFRVVPRVPRAADPG